MDLILDIIVEVVFSWMEKAIRQIKNEKLQVFAAAAFALISCVAAVGFGIWIAISYYQKGNLLTANFCGALVVILILFLVLIFLRRIRNRKNK